MGSFGTLFFLYTKLSRQDVLLSIDQELLRVVESPTRWVALPPMTLGCKVARRGTPEPPAHFPPVYFLPQSAVGV